MRGTPRGFTLLEVMVVVAILGVIVGVSGLAFASLRVPRKSAWTRAATQARVDAIRLGRPARAPVPDSLAAPLFLPDGRAIGPGVDPLTGLPLRAAR